MTQGSESVVVPRAVDDALKALRSVSSSVSEDADEMGASLTCLAAADALQRLWSEVVTTWRASAFPRDAEHDGELADTMDQLLGAPLAAAPSTSVREEVEGLKAKLKAERRRATDAEYMRDAYRRMLGPKGQQVVAAWDAAGLTRIHVSWGPDAASLDGEGIAQAHIDMAEAAKTATPIEDVDSHIAALVPSPDEGKRHG